MYINYIIDRDFTSLHRFFNKDSQFSFDGPWKRLNGQVQITKAFVNMFGDLKCKHEILSFDIDENPPLFCDIYITTVVNISVSIIYCSYYYLYYYYYCYYLFIFIIYINYYFMFLYLD
jgi:hypothetical protein